MKKDYELLSFEEVGASISKLREKANLRKGTRREMQICRKTVR
jgi:hypothetical protein